MTRDESSSFALFTTHDIRNYILRIVIHPFYNNLWEERYRTINMYSIFDQTIRSELVWFILEKNMVRFINIIKICSKIAGASKI